MAEEGCMGRMGARKAVGLGLVVLAAMAALGAVLMLLWNALVPGLFGLRPVGYWQALGLLVLVRLLFGGGHPRQARAWDWRRRMVQRWEAMTPEERERFRRGLHGRFCRLDEPEPPAGGGRDQ